MTPLLELVDVHSLLQDRREHGAALRGVSLKVRRGEFVAIMGSSGRVNHPFCIFLACSTTLTAAST